MALPTVWLTFALLVAGFAAAIVAALLLYRRLNDRGDELEQLKTQILEWNRQLEQRVSQRTGELEESNRRLQETYLETVMSLIEAMSAKDTYLYGHSHNVATYARSIAEEMGLSKEQINRLLQGCELHDLGKIAIPDSILLKKGPLTEQEFEIIKQHPLWGARILEPLTFMKDIMEMVHQEHERWDGTGYPQSLKGGEIQLTARIISVADAMDAMTSHRPYRQSITMEEACREIKRCSGTQFDPQVVEATLVALAKGKLAVADHVHPPVVLKAVG